MKKLLALVLCVMLFVSVIPTAAFAATSTGSAVSLYNAVQQQKRLYNSFSYLWNDKTVVGLVNMFVTKYPDLIKNNADARAAVQKLIDDGYMGTAKFDDTKFLLGSDLNRLVSTAYDDVRQAFVGEIHTYSDIKDKIDAKEKFSDGTITSAIANVEIGVINSIPAQPELPAVQ